MLPLVIRPIYWPEMFPFAKVAWLRVDTQTILTIQNHVITKNHRISITNTEKKIWQLRIRDVKESDKGWYMCQINTDPMKSQMGYLNVVGEFLRFHQALLSFHQEHFLSSLTGYFRRSNEPRYNCSRIRKRDDGLRSHRITWFVIELKVQRLVTFWPESESFKSRRFSGSAKGN